MHSRIMRKGTFNDKRGKNADVPRENRLDSYCWVCHERGFEMECNQDKCQRVYHFDCLEENFTFINGVCPECQQHRNKHTFLTVDNLRRILEIAVDEINIKFESVDKLMFYTWPNIEDSELVRPIDMKLLLDKIRDKEKSYRSLPQFISDVKWFHHNYCILDGVHSSTAKEAEGFVRLFQKEIFDIEDCPMCYYNMLVPRKRNENFFLKICDPPHDIVWAKLKGSLYWPAKCLRVVNGKAHVRFFYTHDKSNIPLDKKCLAISLHHPEYKSSKITDKVLIPKKKEYREAVEELLDYISLYEEEFNVQFKYHLVGTPYTNKAPIPRCRKNRMDYHCVPIDQYSEESIIEVQSSEVGNLSVAVEDGMHISEENSERSESPTMDPCMHERANEVCRYPPTGQSNMPVSRTQNLLSDTAASFQDESSSSSQSLDLVSGSESLAMDCDESVSLHTSPSTSSRIPNEDADDVVFICSNQCPQKSVANSSSPLDHFNSNPDFPTLFRNGRCVFDSLFARCWRAANRSPTAPEVMDNIICAMKKVKADNRRLEKDNQDLEEFNKIENEKVYQEELFNLQENTDELQRQCDDMAAKLKSVKENGARYLSNSQIYIEALHKEYTEAFDSSKKEIFSERDKTIQVKNKKVRAMKHKILQLKKDINDS